jgi:probable phosphoglycerate mutase
VSGQSPTSLRIYLARHGQTDWNIEHRLQGSKDTPLNSTGREQATTLAERLKGVRLDAVYSSTLRRSRETAEIVRGSVPLRNLAGLNERRLGTFEGRRADASDPVTAGDYERRSQDPDDTLDGGESLSQFFERVRTTMTGIRTQHPSGAILIVSHGGTNQMIVRTLLGQSADAAHSFEQANGELYLVELGSDNPYGCGNWSILTSLHTKRSPERSQARVYTVVSSPFMRRRVNAIRFCCFAQPCESFQERATCGEHECRVSFSSRASC